LIDRQKHHGLGLLADDQTTEFAFTPTTWIVRFDPEPEPFPNGVFARPEMLR
jgi:hypothetical protein